MAKIVDIHKFAVDGANAERICEILKTSYLVENKWQPFEDFNVEIEFKYSDGVLRVEEKVTGTSPCMSFMAEILYFFASKDNVFCMTEHIVDDVVLQC